MSGAHLSLLGLHRNKKAAPLTLRATLLTHHKTQIYLPHSYYTTSRARARKPRPGQRQLLLRHLEGNLKDLIRDTERLTVALEYHESLPQGCAVSQRWVKLARPKDQRRQMAL